MEFAECEDCYLEWTDFRKIAEQLLGPRVGQLGVGGAEARVAALRPGLVDAVRGGQGARQEPGLELLVVGLPVGLFVGLPVDLLVVARLVGLEPEA